MRFNEKNVIRKLPVFIISVLIFNVLQAGAQNKIHVTVSISPQKYFVEKIGGDLVDVTVMVPSGAEPHTYEPKPRQLINISKSAVYCAIGITFEQTWLKRFSAANPPMMIVHTDEGIQKIPVHTHEEEGKTESGHHHGHLDPHIWLSPQLVKRQAEHIYDALVKVDQGNKETYSLNYNAFIEELDELDTYLKTVIQEKNAGFHFIVLHPSWGYFANEYGLEQVPIEIEGKEPKAADIVKLIDTAKRLGIKTIFIQPQFSERSARTIAEAIEGKIIVADPLSENWDENLRYVARQIKKAKNTRK